MLQLYYAEILQTSVWLPSPFHIISRGSYGDLGTMCGSGQWSDLLVWVRSFEEQVTFHNVEAIETTHLVCCLNPQQELQFLRRSSSSSGGAAESSQESLHPGMNTLLILVITMVFALAVGSSMSLVSGGIPDIFHEPSQSEGSSCLTITRHICNILTGVLVAQWLWIMDIWHFKGKKIPIPTCSSSCCTWSNLLLQICWYSGQIRSQFFFSCLKAKFIIFQVPAQTGRENTSISVWQFIILSNKMSDWDCFSSERSSWAGLLTWIIGTMKTQDDWPSVLHLLTSCLHSLIWEGHEWMRQCVRQRWNDSLTDGRDKRTMWSVLNKCLNTWLRRFEEKGFVLTWRTFSLCCFWCLRLHWYIYYASLR